MAFMMPVMKNDWDIYNSKRSRQSSESTEKGGVGARRVRKVSESRSEGPTLSPRSAGSAVLSPHRSAPAMRSLSYCRAPPSRASRASLRAATATGTGTGSQQDSPGKRAGSGSASPAGGRDTDKFHCRARAASPERHSRCGACVPYL